MDDKNFDFDIANQDTAEENFRLLGKKLRRSLEGNNFIDQCRTGLNTLGKITYTNDKGVEMDYRTHTELTVDKFSFETILTTACWSMVGANLTEIFGKWDRTKHVMQDDSQAGFWALLYWVGTIMTWWMCSLSALYKSMVDRDKTSGLGTRVAFISARPSTWNAHYMQAEIESEAITTGMGSPVYFGNFLESDINNSDLRNTNIPILEHALKEFEDSENGLFTVSKWTWRFGRTIEVIPIFVPFSDTNRLSTDDKLATCLFPFTDYATEVLNTKSLISRYVNLVGRIKNTYFLNNILGGLKQYFVDKRFYDLSEFNEGKGGLAWFQSTHMADSVIGAKYETLYGAADDFRLQERRDAEDIYRIEIIGKVPRVLMTKIYALQVARIKGEIISDTEYFDSNDDVGAKIIEPVGFVAQSVSRAEGRGWWISYLAMKFSANSVFDEGNNDSVKPWKFSVTDTDITYLAEAFEDKHGLIAGRRVKDPMKKLYHEYIDLNWFDVDIVKAIRNTMFLPNAVLSYVKDKESGEVYPSGIRKRPDHTGKSGKEWWKKKNEDDKSFKARVSAAGDWMDEKPSGRAEGETLVPGRLDVIDGDDATPPKKGINDPQHEDGIKNESTPADPRYDNKKTVGAMTPSGGDGGDDGADDDDSDDTDVVVSAKGDSPEDAKKKKEEHKKKMEEQAAKKKKKDDAKK
jgi:hypothetical protein